MRPVFADFDGDKQLDLFVPQNGVCKMFANRGGRLFDVTPNSGDLAQPVGQATSAVAADFDGDGKTDLVIGCLKGPNRYFRNVGNGKFADATSDMGFYQRIFNTRGLAAADVNKDGVSDLLMNNEGQESTVLIGRPKQPLAGQVSAGK